MVIVIKNKEDFESKLNDAGSHLVVVDFFATWCGPCKMISPKLEELSVEYENVIFILKVDVEDCDDLATEYGITSMPTFILIKNKEVVAQFSGANYDKLKQLVLENK